jgi:hypothetical protein
MRGLGLRIRDCIGMPARYALAPSPPIPAHTTQMTATTTWSGIGTAGVFLHRLLASSSLPLASRIIDPTTLQAARVSQKASHRSLLCNRGSEFGRIGMPSGVTDTRLGGLPPTLMPSRWMRTNKQPLSSKDADDAPPTSSRRTRTMSRRCRADGRGQRATAITTHVASCRQRGRSPRRGCWRCGSRCTPSH